MTLFQKKLALLVFLPPLLGLACAGALGQLDEVNDPGDDKALKECRNEGREARDAGLGEVKAYRVYVDCRKEAGLQ